MLRERFGHEAFRSGQEPAIRALLAGRDVLALLPTGGGKSLIYQLAAELLPGATLVVSPLIALIRDQVESLAAVDVAGAAVDSTLTDAEAAEQLERFRRRELTLLYVTPERLGDESFLAAITDVPISLLVVDEAHCISEWGHSFRPAYLEVGAAVPRLGRPTLLAVTATATPWVREEIVERLGMADPLVVARGADRPNLFFEVVRVEDEHAERRTLEELVRGGAEGYEGPLADDLSGAMAGPGIVYVATTAAARETARWLRSWGVAADYYHGQRRKADRTRVQDGFMRGDIRVVAATNAFGLGVDKQDVRFVVHRDVPSSVEAYYQEAGRAGRDGQLARCILLYRPAALGRAAFLGASGGDERHKEYERSRLDMLRAYAEARDCRRVRLLGYFGEEVEDGRCGLCDACRGADVAVPVADLAPPSVSPFAAGDAVVHAAWGAGQVQLVTGDSLTVLFEEVGYKTLAADVVQEHGLLAFAERADR